MEPEQSPRRRKQRHRSSEHEWQAAEMALRLVSIIVELGARHLGW